MLASTCNIPDRFSANELLQEGQSGVLVPHLSAEGNFASGEPDRVKCSSVDRFPDLPPFPCVFPSGCRQGWGEDQGPREREGGIQKVARVLPEVLREITLKEKVLNSFLLQGAKGTGSSRGLEVFETVAQWEGPVKQPEEEVVPLPVNRGISHTRPNSLPLQRSQFQIPSSNTRRHHGGRGAERNQNSDNSELISFQSVSTPIACSRGSQGWI